ncbi:MAG: exo-alpha-sialidase [Clostridiales bacterium]|nr:exo-alpha-sialidase [Clostridiales bacterium]
MEKRLKAKHGIVCRLEGNPFGYFGWPSVARLGNGVLVAGCSGFRLAHICPFGKTVLFYSLDNGDTWSPPVVVNDTLLDDRDVGLLALGGNRLLLTWFNLDIKYFRETFASYMKENMPPNEYRMSMEVVNNYTDEMNEREVGSFVRLSNDGGITWEKPHRMPVTSPHGPCLLSDGSLFMVGKDFEIKEDTGKIMAFKSYDDGASWQYVSTIPLPEGVSWSNFFEPHSIQLPSGRIITHIRFQDAKRVTSHLPFTVFQTVSGDMGKTWSTPVPLGMSGSPPHIIRHSSGALICVYGRREVPFGQRAMISTDDGETWDVDWIIRDDGTDGDLGYPASAELPNGEILTVYYQRYRKGEKTSILWSKWTLPDI